MLHLLDDIPKLTRGAFLKKKKENQESKKYRLFLNEMSTYENTTQVVNILL